MCISLLSKYIRFVLVLLLFFSFIGICYYLRSNVKYNAFVYSVYFLSYQ